MIETGSISGGISTSTVGTYVQRIYEKLHVSSRREIMERSGKNE